MHNSVESTQSQICPVQTLFQYGKEGRIRRKGDFHSIRYIQGLKCSDSYESCYPINGHVGLELFHTDSESCLAVMGYNLELNSSGLTMTVEHTPQGALPGALTGKIKHQFRGSPFRDIMMQELIAIAREYDIHKIQVLSANNHPKVHCLDIGLERALKVIDNVALRNGFAYDSACNLVLDL